MKKILDFLYPFIEPINDEIENLNYGGCGVFAVQCYLFLKALGFKPRIVVVDGEQKVLNAIRENRIPRYGSCAHVVVRLGNSYIDSYQVYTDKHQLLNRWGERTATVVPLNLMVLWNSEATWNYDFDRDQIPLIEAFFESLLPQAHEELSKNLQRTDGPFRRFELVQNGPRVLQKAS